MTRSTWELMDADHQARALAMGLFRCDGRPTCPRFLVGLRCLTDLDANGELVKCWCYSPMHEHAAVYARRDLTGDLILWEPYPVRVYDGTLTPVLLGAFRDGLTVTRLDASPYNPGQTVALAFEAGRHT